MGRPNIEYLFTVTYTDADNDKPTSIKVFIDQVDFEMEEVDPTDLNYSDGKEYLFRSVLGEGAYSIYYSADDGNGDVVNTNSFTLSVTWSVGHYDIIHFIEDKVFPGLILVLIVLFVVVLVLCLISIFMAVQLRRIAKELKGKREGEDELEEEKKEHTKQDVEENLTQ
jgi:flagellar biosynthesis/type III secretory pathway M-ring protein FliF/YscJ